MKEHYTDVNSAAVDRWVAEGWVWGRPIDHDTFVRARQGDWSVVLTPTIPVPKDWFCAMEGAEILGLASGGGQQMPIFAALGANCTVMDYSAAQLSSERMVAEREQYPIRLVQADMTKAFPFEDECFDLIFHPVSNCYVEDVIPIWRECYRVLKPGGILLAAFDNGINYVFDDDERQMQYKLPYNPLRDPKLYEASIQNNWGIQFSHTIEEQLGGQLKAGFILYDIYQDTNGTGNLHDHGVPSFYATRAVKVRP